MRFASGLFYPTLRFAANADSGNSTLDAGVRKYPLSGEYPTVFPDASTCQDGSYPVSRVLRGMVHSVVMMDAKKLGIGALSAIVLVVALIVTLRIFTGERTSATRPTSWNSRAIQARFSGVKVREVDPASADLIFSFDLDNTTDADYQLAKGPNVVIMSRLKSDGSFSSEQEVNLNSSIFVPAGNRTRVALEIVRPFQWPAQQDAASDAKFRQLVVGQVADLDGFVLFDQTTRYQIDLPGEWPEFQEVSEAAARP
jgi:hypothetical protein